MRIKKINNKENKIIKEKNNNIFCKIIILSLLIILSINIFTKVQATENIANNSETNSTLQTADNKNLKSYTLEDPGMYIKIDTNMIEIVSGLENNDERLNTIENKEEYKSYLEQSGIVLDAVNNIGENNDKEIIVVKSNNVAYQTLPNLNQFSEEDLNNYYSQFMESIKSQAEKTQIEVQKEELYKTQNGNVYFHIISQGEIGGIPTKLSTYYTIMNQRLVTIGFRYFNTEIDSNENTVIEATTFENLPRDNSYQEQMNKVTTIVIIILAIFIITFLIIRRKDAKKISSEVKDKELKSYLKFGGILSLMWILMIYQVYLRILDINTLIQTDGILAYRIIMIIECILAFAVNLFIAIKILIRKKQSVKHIKMGLIINAIIILIASLTRIISMIAVQKNIPSIEYFEQEFSLLIYNAVYTAIWFFYMKFSQRVKIYYYEQDEIHYYRLNEMIKNIKEKIKNKKEKHTNETKKKGKK